ncbi:MAG TPA: hypothetical protein VHU83_05310 [Bryobacteraceae bacterium]|jgi:hypothetical protein|nr:hypothetical protein [Bryobacteraceae bacterium]
MPLNAREAIAQLREFAEQHVFDAAQVCVQDLELGIDLLVELQVSGVDLLVPPSDMCVHDAVVNQDANQDG